MAFYSSGDVKTHYIDPKSFLDGNRAVFQLPGHHIAYLPNMRLLEVGVFGQAGGNYNELIGANDIIREITLFDGSTILTQLTNYGLYRGFQLQNTTNSNAMSVVDFKSAGGKLGFQQLSADGLLQHILRSRTTAAARNASNGAYIELREVLPMLNSVTHLPSDVFQNLRLEVVFNTEAAEQILQDVTHTITGQLFPILAVDVLDNKSIVDKMNRGIGKSIAWLEVEHDQVTYEQSANNGAAGDQGVEEVKNFKLDGFKNKSVERIVQVKELQDKTKYLNGNDVLGFGRFQSVALFNEKLQIRLNGRNIFPNSGLTKNMERLGQVVDTYGDCVAYPGSNQVDIDTGIVAGTDATNGRAKIGNLSYNCAYLGEKIMDLQVEHSRTGLEDTTGYRPSTDALNVHYFGEVRKAVVFDNKGYNIVYL
jgi:hypothetical protein